MLLLQDFYHRHELTFIHYNQKNSTGAVEISSAICITLQCIFLEMINLFFNSWSSFYSKSRQRIVWLLGIGRLVLLFSMQVARSQKAWFNVVYLNRLFKLVSFHKSVIYIYIYMDIHGYIHYLSVILQMHNYYFYFGV